METALERISRLERHNRRMLVALVGLLLLFGLSVAAVRSADDTVRTQMLGIADDSGKARIQAAAFPDGGILTMLDTAKRARLSLAATNEKSIVQFRDASNNEALSYADASDEVAIQTEIRGGTEAAFVGISHKAPGHELPTPGMFVANEKSAAAISIVAGRPSMKFGQAENQHVRFGESVDDVFGFFIENSNISAFRPTTPPARMASVSRSTVRGGARRFAASASPN